MSSKFAPSDPEKVMIIRDILPNITTLSVPFCRVGLFKIGGRATIVKLRTGALAVFSPVALTPTVHSKLKSLSGTETEASAPVRYILAPDLEHHIFLSSWAAAFPSATIVGPAGLLEKRQKDSEQSKTPIHVSISPTSKAVSEEFDAEFEVEPVFAHPNRELVFCHKPSKTMIQADFLWNLPAKEQYSGTPGGEAESEKGWMTRMINGCYNGRGEALAQRRLVWWGLSRGDRKGFGESVRRIDKWEWENVVGCHGDVMLVGEGRRVFGKVFPWFLEGLERKAKDGKKDT